MFSFGGITLMIGSSECGSTVTGVEVGGSLVLSSEVSTKL